MVIIYEDRATGGRAKYFYDNLVRELEDKCDFNLELWNFQVLAITEIGFQPRESQPKLISSFFLPRQSWASGRDSRVDCNLVPANCR